MIYVIYGDNMKYVLPKIIKEELGEDVYNKMQQVIEDSPVEKRELVIWASKEFIDEIERMLEEETKRILWYGNYN